MQPVMKGGAVFAVLFVGVVVVARLSAPKPDDRVASSPPPATPEDEARTAQVKARVKGLLDADPVVQRLIHYGNVEDPKSTLFMEQRIAHYDAVVRGHELQATAEEARLLQEIDTGTLAAEARAKEEEDAIIEAQVKGDPEVVRFVRARGGDDPGVKAFVERKRVYYRILADQMRDFTHRVAQVGAKLGATEGVVGRTGRRILNELPPNIAVQAGDNLIELRMREEMRLEKFQNAAPR